MTSGKKARALRKENPKPIVEKRPTPWFMRKSLVLRQGPGRELHQIQGSSKSNRQLAKISKIWNPDPRAGRNRRRVKNTLLNEEVIINHDIPSTM